MGVVQVAEHKYIAFGTKCVSLYQASFVCVWKENKIVYLINEEKQMFFIRNGMMIER
jgi:hypothetical protein